ncbi:GntR family transcriptional regulator [Enterococcus faecium]
MKINRKNNYDNVRTQILTDIQSDILQNRKKGDKLPSESSYAEKYQVARSTIQKVFKDLESLQLVERIQGKGSFVKNIKPKINIVNYKGFSDYASEMGSSPITRQIIKEVIDNGKHLYLQRLRGICIDGKNIWLTLDETYIDLVKYPKLDLYDFEKNSLYDVLRKYYNTSPSTAHLSSSAVFASTKESELLEVDTQIPLLKIEGDILDETGEVLENVKILYGPNTNFQLTVGI